jgi:hypothetical protein
MATCTVCSTAHQLNAWEKSAIGRNASSVTANDIMASAKKQSGPRKTHHWQQIT